MKGSGCTARAWKTPAWAADGREGGEEGEEVRYQDLNRRGRYKIIEEGAIQGDTRSGGVPVTRDR